MQFREMLEHCARNTFFFVRAIVCIFSSVGIRQATSVKINVSLQCNTSVRVKYSNSLLFSRKWCIFAEYTRMEKEMKLELTTGRCECSFVKILKLITLIRILLSDFQSRVRFPLPRVIQTNYIMQSYFSNALRIINLLFRICLVYNIKTFIVTNYCISLSLSLFYWQI